MRFRSWMLIVYIIFPLSTFILSRMKCHPFPLFLIFDMPRNMPTQYLPAYHPHFFMLRIIQIDRIYYTHTHRGPTSMPQTHLKLVNTFSPLSLPRDILSLWHTRELACAVFHTGSLENVYRIFLKLLVRNACTLFWCPPKPLPKALTYLTTPSQATADYMLGTGVLHEFVAALLRVLIWRLAEDAKGKA